MSKAKLKTIENNVHGEFEWIFVTGAGRKNVDPETQEVKPNTFEVQVKVHKDDPRLKLFEAEIAAYFKAEGPKGKPMKTNGIKEEEFTNPAGVTRKSGFKLIKLKTLTKFPDEDDGTEGDKKVIVILTTAGKDVTERMKKVKLGNGSTGYALGSMKVYERGTGNGVALFLEGLQLTKFVEYKTEVKPVDPTDGDGSWSPEDEVSEGDLPGEGAAKPDDIDL